MSSTHSTNLMLSWYLGQSLFVPPVSCSWDREDHYFCCCCCCLLPAVAAVQLTVHLPGSTSSLLLASMLGSAHHLLMCQE